MNPIEFFVLVTMILAVIMFVMIIIIASSKPARPNHDYTHFPAIACCCLGGIVVIMISMVAFLLSQGYGQYIMI